MSLILKELGTSVLKISWDLYMCAHTVLDQLLQGVGRIFFLQIFTWSTTPLVLAICLR